MHPTVVGLFPRFPPVGGKVLSSGKGKHGKGQGESAFLRKGKARERAGGKCFPSPLLFPPFSPPTGGKGKGRKGKGKMNTRRGVEGKRGLFPTPLLSPEGGKGRKGKEKATLNLLGDYGQSP